MWNFAVKISAFEPFDQYACNFDGMEKIMIRNSMYSSLYSSLQWIGLLVSSSDFKDIKGPSDFNILWFAWSFYLIFQSFYFDMKV